MATVKGDVHDIGKNIVGVVLQCNNFEIIDLGVMVPSNKIIETAIKENVDLIGLSGLITPSLDEMCFVASELKRNNITKPLLIGGATTSKIHTAIKIDPLYDSGVCHVTDASKAVAVASNLISKNKVKPFTESLAKEYSSLRNNYFKKEKSSLNNIENCRKNLFQFDWNNYKPPIPKVKKINFQSNISIKKISKFIDWKPFFEAWELYGKFPDILEDEIVGKAASDLWKDAQMMLDKITKEKLTIPKAVFGFWSANSVGDDIVIYDEKTKVEISRLFFLRQQIDRSKSKRANFCLADFIAPTSENIKDYIGGFIVTAGEGIEKLAKYYEDKNDDYNSILVKSLGDRIAEALAEMLHVDVRTKFWGYAKGEKFSNDQLINEEYIGIRPAPGYPACPDHTEKKTLFKLLKANENIKVKLTESYAMTPSSSVSGFYFSNPSAAYFGVGKVYEDQVEDYAKRKGVDKKIAEKWLSSSLGYAIED